jgi:uncharacterized protein
MSTGITMHPPSRHDWADQSDPISQLMVEVAARSHSDCPYCFWFHDAELGRKPNLMSASVADQLLKRLEEHIARHRMETFLVILHGSEPLLWGIENFRRFARGCEVIGMRTGCKISIAATTSGALISEAWLDCFAEHEIAIALSIDGPAHVHDIDRGKVQDEGTRTDVGTAVRLLQSRGVAVNALAVCNPALPAKDFVDFFAAAGITRYDIMFPDAPLAGKTVAVAAFYKELFDHWLEANRKEAKVEVRTIVDMVLGLLGGGEGMGEGFGHQSAELCTVRINGTIEVHDGPRGACDGSPAMAFNIFDGALQEIRHEPRFQAARAASMDLADKCRQCKFVNACGGGYLAHRHSRANGYKNPSAYCQDLYETFEHIQAALDTRA